MNNIFVAIILELLEYLLINEKGKLLVLVQEYMMENKHIEYYLYHIQ